MGHTGLRVKRVSRAKHRTARLDGVEALPNHGDDRARSHVLDQTREERLLLQVLVVCTTVRYMGFVITYGSAGGWDSRFSRCSGVA